MGEKARLVRTFLFFWIFLMLFKFGAGLQYTLLSPLGERVMPLWLVGLLLFIVSMFQFAFQIPAGRLLDRFGYRKMLMVASVVALAGVLALYFGVSVVSFILTVFLVEIGWLFFTPGISAYSLSHAKRRNALSFMANRDVFTSVGIVFACILLPFVVNGTGRFLSILLGGLILASLAAIYLAPRDTKKIKASFAPHERTHHQRRYLLSNLPRLLKRMSPASSILILLTGAAGIFYGVVWFVVPLLVAADAHNGTILGAGLATFDFATVVVGSLLLGMVQKTEKKLMVMVGLLVFSLSGLLLGVNFGILFLVFAFLSAAGDEVASLPLWAWLHKLDSEHNRDGLISGAISLSSDIGWAVGPLMAGIFYFTAGPTLTIVLGTLPIVVLLAMYYLVVRKHVISVSLLEAPKMPHKPRHKT